MKWKWFNASWQWKWPTRWEHTSAAECSDWNWNCIRVDITFNFNGNKLTTAQRTLCGADNNTYRHRCNLFWTRYLHSTCSSNALGGEMGCMECMARVCLFIEWLNLFLIHNKRNDRFCVPDNRLFVPGSLQNIVSHNWNWALTLLRTPAEMHGPLLLIGVALPETAYHRMYPICLPILHEPGKESEINFVCFCSVFLNFN